VSISSANSFPHALNGTPIVAEVSTSGPLPSRIASLTRRIAAGDEEAFREFHTQYFDQLYRFLLVVTRGQEDEAKEALQETLLRVVRHTRTFESDEAFWGWLKVVARNAARDAGRKQRRYRNLLERFTLLGTTTINEPIAEDNCLRIALEESLGELPPLDRKLIEGKYACGDTVRELAADAGLTEKSVESRLLRLRRQLRELMLKKLRGP
jgi:RNA polymerase sigma-70 factor, ECF subfamily